MPGRVSVLVALTAFAIYAFLCPPVSGMGDGSEFTLVLATGGVAHPTGYPIYTLLGHLFCVLLHALGAPWAFAANLWSAAGGGLAIGLLLLTAMELAAMVPGAGATTRFVAALIPVSLFAFQPVVLAEATRAEINIWSLAWVCGTACLFLRLMGAMGDAQPIPPRRARWVAVLWGLICGLGLAHHLTSVLVSAPLSAALLMTLSRRRVLTAATVLAAAGAALLPIASYGILGWHAWHPARVQWYLLVPGLASVWRHITGAEYRAYVGYFNPSAYDKELLARAIYPFLIPALGLLLLGLARARESGTRSIWAAFLGAAGLVTGFVFRYGVPDPSPYFLPAIALGAAAAAPALAAIPGAASRAGAAALATAGLAGLLLIVPWIRDGAERRTDAIQYDKVIHSMWSSIPPAPAIVSWSDDRFYRLIEYQVLRGEKPAVVVLAPDLILEGLTHDEILRRFGVDPVAGFNEPPIQPGSPHAEERMREYRLRLVRHLNGRVRVPVIIFDPEKPIVWQMRKPWEPPVAEPALRAPVTGRAHPPPP